MPVPRSPHGHVEYPSDRPGRFPERQQHPAYPLPSPGEGEKPPRQLGQDAPGVKSSQEWQRLWGRTGRDT